MRSSRWWAVLPYAGRTSVLRQLVTQACLLLTVMGATAAHAQSPVRFPLRPSADGRTLVDAARRPFFVQADSAWTIAKKLTAAEVDEYLDHRRKQGFNTIFLHAVSKEGGPATNHAGHDPFDPADDITKPNEPYWSHVDHVVDAAAKRGMLVGISALWIRWGQGDKHGWRGQLTAKGAEVYGKFLARRYRKHQNVLWILGGDANPGNRRKETEILAASLKAIAPHHLVTFHAAPEFSSAVFFHQRPWHDLNLAYTYGETFRQVLAEYHRTPPRPILLGESGYEEESNDGRGGAPSRMRRQAWSAVLSGALVGHAYGHRAIWQFAPDWRKALDAPGARHMTVMKNILEARAWHTLIPDLETRVVVGNTPKAGDKLRLCAAAARDQSHALVYIPSGRTIEIAKDALKRPFAASWLDPTSGARQVATPTAVRDGEAQAFTTPAANAGGDEDWVLLLEGATVARR